MSTVPRAVIFGLAGPRLTPDERDFFADADPLGFILFRRNCEEPAQIRDLTAALRDAVGRSDAPILIDQEGGRVQRLRPPHWRDAPAAKPFGALYRRDPAAALEATRLNARLLAADLADCGISVDCAPVLDLGLEGAHDVIGDRAFDRDPAVVIALGRAFCEGLRAGGVMPILKHIPGHGRSMVDSHVDLPRVAEPAAVLAETDFAPFLALSTGPACWAMTAHILYEALDAAAPATLSATVIAEVIRGRIGFDGVLLSDDVSMEALEGSIGDRAARSLGAGCDLTLHCNGDADEMRAVAAAVGPMSAAAAMRVARAAASLDRPGPLDRAAADARVRQLLALA